MNTRHWKIEPVIHESQKRLALHFPYNKDDNDYVRTLKGSRWSNTHKCWHVEDNAYYRKLLGLQEDEKTYAPKSAHAVAEGGYDKIVEYTRWMRSRNYSENTIKTYTDALRVFLSYYKDKRVVELTNKDVIDFNNDYIKAKGYSTTFQNQVVNALKLFFGAIAESKIVTEKVHRPRSEKKLPNVLSKEEVKELIESCSNIKHKCMLTLIYACGLRRSELLNLKLGDVDAKRKLLLIKNGKGKKDRICPLSDKVLQMLRDYYSACKPKEYLFEGMYGGQYDERSLASVLKRALQSTNIRKPVTLHWLRHSYATHLLESGTDLRYIQELLGHKHSKTTEIYTHVSTRSIQQIKSPFDDLGII